MSGYGGRLDHGILNVPLAKRGNIDAQIDRYKAEQARAAVKAIQASRDDLRCKRARVHAIIDGLSDDRVMALAKATGSRKPSTARTALKRATSYNMDRWLAALEREVQPC